MTHISKNFKVDHRWISLYFSVLFFYLSINMYHNFLQSTIIKSVLQENAHKLILLLVFGT